MIQTRHGEAIPLWMGENKDGQIEVVFQIEDRSAGDPGGYKPQKKREVD